jgi:hypothetical protein
MPLANVAISTWFASWVNESCCRIVKRRALPRGRLFGVSACFFSGIYSSTTSTASTLCASACDSYLLSFQIVTQVSSSSSYLTRPCPSNLLTCACTRGREHKNVHTPTHAPTHSRRNVDKTGMGGGKYDVVRAGLGAWLAAAVCSCSYFHCQPKVPLHSERSVGLERHQCWPGNIWVCTFLLSPAAWQVQTMSRT